MKTKSTKIDQRFIPKDDGVPEHDVIIMRRATDPCRRILMQPLEIPHQPLPRWRRHPSKDPIFPRIPQLLHPKIGSFFEFLSFSI